MTAEKIIGSSCLTFQKKNYNSDPGEFSLAASYGNAVVLEKVFRQMDPG